MKVTPVPHIKDLPPRPCPLFSSAVAAGFPSPADDYLEGQLDLNEYLLKRPHATYLARAQGESMVGRGIGDGDILVIDRSVEARNGSIVIAALHGELCCKILDTTLGQLLSANPAFPPIPIPEDGLDTEGVVLFAIKHLG